MPSADPYIGREILGQFRILERVGSGGMGAVYKAEQPAMDRLVAVKILHPKLASRKDLVSRFRREARAMSHLTHPNTVRVFLYGQLDDGSLYIVMEFLAGKNLAQLVRSDGPMSFDRALPVMIQACGALEEAHRQGIVHRDLKPENIFLCTQGGIADYAKVLDFGLAKVTEREMRPGSLILTQEGMVFGTPEFMSPEQAQGKTLDPRSDIYSLGVILYELLTGKLPFAARVPMEYISLHVNAVPIPLAERAPTRRFPPGLQAVMDRALAKNPDERYQTAAEFAAALKAVLPDGTKGSMAAIPPPLGGGGGGGLLAAPSLGTSMPTPVQSAGAQTLRPGFEPAPTPPISKPRKAPTPAPALAAPASAMPWSSAQGSPSGPSELGDGLPSAAPGRPPAASFPQDASPSSLPVAGLILVGLLLAIAAVVYLSTGGNDQTPTTASPGPIKLPSPVVPLVVRTDLRDSGIVSVAANADAGTTVSTSVDASPRPTKDPPERQNTAPPCPSMAEASMRAAALACADRLTSTDTFSISYRIDRSGRAGLTFGGAQATAPFRSCMVGHVVTLHMPGVTTACRGRFRFP